MKKAALGYIVCGAIATGLASFDAHAQVTGPYANIGTNNTIASGTTLSSITGGHNNSISNSYPLGAVDFIGGGNGNSITSVNSSILGGFANSITANESMIGGGFHNAASGLESTIAGGLDNIASGFGSIVPGGSYANASHSGQMAHASGRFANVGDAQTSEYNMFVQSTSTNQELYLDGSSALITLPTNSASAFNITIVVQGQDGTSAAFRTNGLIKNVAGTTTLIGGPLIVSPYAADSSASTWSVIVEADTVNNALAVVGNSDSSTNRWVATVRATEVQQ